MSFFKRLKSGLSKTREQLSKQVDALLTGSRVDAETYEELEDLLIMADFGVETAQAIIQQTRERSKKAEDGDQVRDALKAVIRDHLQSCQSPRELTAPGPHVILIVGVNGVGKTTTIGKLAAYHKQQGRSVMLAAGDTFRAAAVEQLKLWGERVDAPVIAQGQDADSASVIHDAYESARARGVDVLIADTAGRLHTKSNLMEELKKIRRVLGKLDASAPHDVWLVLDATTGQNAISQVQTFHDAMTLTGLAITKLDGTAKGGVVVGLSERFGLPVRYVGVGEGVDDLRPFDAAEFADALFDSAAA
ncbi:signal recognition particle-docking protein FtsY [Magnetofaba australis]|uniref:Signal recognition particle receptor FtsY n=1 Tax=Magnetofaba australis IT-1 TaxID=1434232 RepID=A0A1Y2K2Q1_9PROT|nr:signal recognition particle-docking protein FtsY [Magnetofaba australis]OSM02321.1 putative signal recognition particle-docking protein FtsY [Magnetofaba australis IT-1]